VREMVRPCVRAVVLALVAVAAGVSATESRAQEGAGCEVPVRPFVPPKDLPHYSLDVRLTHDLRAAVGRVTVAFAPDIATDRLVFRLWPNAAPYARSGAQLRVGPVTSAGRRLSTSSPNATTLVVRVTLAAGEHITVSMGWHLRLPRSGGLCLHGGSSVRLGTFFPLLAWEPSVGWATDPPPVRSAGETWTSPAADFDVRIKRPRGLAVLATGEALGDGHWRARAVRDFAVAVGRFRITRATVAVPQPVRVTIGAEKGSYASPQSFLPPIRPALQSYSARFGPYPWSRYTAAVMSDFAVGGYEYPTLVFLGSASEHQAAHETAHQWFCSLVGNDQARDPWLDEALATWSETAVEPTHSLAFFGSQPIPNALRNHLGQPMTFWDRLGFPAFFTGLMAQGVQALAMLGDPATVDCALRLYGQTNAYGIATNDKLLTALQGFFPAAEAILAGYGVHF
jgi:Peptidase family M1 domain